MSEQSTESEKDTPGVIAPPPLLFAGMLALALALDWMFAGPNLMLPAVARYVGGAVLIAAGLAIPIAAITRFRAVGTEVHPWRPSTALVTTGIYRYTRNPMYLGMTLIYAGLAMISDSVIAFALVPALLLLVTGGVIKREERYLEVKFGEPYRAYKRQVRRWI